MKWIVVAITVVLLLGCSPREEDFTASLKINDLDERAVAIASTPACRSLKATGRVRIAAPARTSLDAIRAFAIAHVGWIRRNQRKIKMQEREPPREYVDRESHFVWGERVMLHVVERDGPPSIVRRHRTLILQVRPGTTVGEKQRVMESWYRDEVRRAAAPVRAKWEEHLGVAVRQTFVQRMKTKWGSCNPLTSNVRLNTDLGKKPPECLDYVVLHELAHLRERTHSPEFFALLDHSMPQWREVRRMLNDLPLTSQSQQHNSGCKIKSA